MYPVIFAIQALRDLVKFSNKESETFKIPLKKIELKVPQKFSLSLNGRGFEPGLLTKTLKGQGFDVIMHFEGKKMPK